MISLSISPPPLSPFRFSPFSAFLSLYIELSRQMPLILTSHAAFAAIICRLSPLLSIRR
jgi:hypothetical protein